MDIIITSTMATPRKIKLATDTYSVWIRMRDADENGIVKCCTSYRDWET